MRGEDQWGVINEPAAQSKFLFWSSVGLQEDYKYKELSGTSDWILLWGVNGSLPRAKLSGDGCQAYFVLSQVYLKIYSTMKTHRNNVST